MVQQSTFPIAKLKFAITCHTRNIAIPYSTSKLQSANISIVLFPDPTICEGKVVWCIWTQSLGQGKEFECSNQITALSKSCDYLSQEFGRTNHNAGLLSLCSLLNHPRSRFDQSEYRFVPLLYIANHTT